MLCDSGSFIKKKKISFHLKNLYIPKKYLVSSKNYKFDMTILHTNRYSCSNNKSTYISLQRQNTTDDKFT